MGTEYKKGTLAGSPTAISTKVALLTGGDILDMGRMIPDEKGRNMGKGSKGLRVEEMERGLTRKKI